MKWFNKLRTTSLLVAKTKQTAVRPISRTIANGKSCGQSRRRVCCLVGHPGENRPQHSAQAHIFRMRLAVGSAPKCCNSIFAMSIANVSAPFDYLHVCLVRATRAHTLAHLCEIEKNQTKYEYNSNDLTNGTYSTIYVMYVSLCVHFLMRMCLPRMHITRT